MATSLPQDIVFPEKVAAAISDGTIWRAKEILRGRIGNGNFEPTLYEQYGVVLLAMGDDMEAGKYLFTSGRRRPEYDSVIQLFLDRHSNKGWRGLASALPWPATSLPADSLPKAVRDALRALGMPIVEGKSAERWTVRDLAIAVGSGLVLSFLVGSFLAGVPVVLRGVAATIRWVAGLLW